MLRQVAEGVLIHESEFLRSNAVVVQGTAGVLLIDPGVRGDEITTIAGDLRELGQTVVAGFSTHPHWDHLLWHAELGAPPRYGTPGCAAAVQAFLSDPSWRDQAAEMLPPEIAGEVPLDLLGRITGLAPGTERIPWEGPPVRIIEHQAHAAGHAALLIEERGVLVAGDMLSDELIPMLDLEAADPIGDYLDGLRRLEDVADRVRVVIPGHGSTGDADQVRIRIAQDRAYVHALRDAADPGDPRLAPSAPHGEWLPDVHEGQVRQLAESREHGTSGSAR